VACLYCRNKEPVRWTRVLSGSSPHLISRRHVGDRQDESDFETPLTIALNRRTIVVLWVRRRDEVTDGGQGCSKLGWGLGLVGGERDEHPVIDLSVDKVS
jgi:hypothetical protein